MDISAFKSWLASERNSIKASINFFDNDKNYDMVAYEYARMSYWSMVKYIMAREDEVIELKKVHRRY